MILNLLLLLIRLLILCDGIVEKAFSLRCLLLHDILHLLFRCLDEVDHVTVNIDASLPTRVTVILKLGQQGTLSSLFAHLASVDGLTGASTSRFLLDV